MRAHMVRVDAVVVQAVIAGALSFSHLHDLAAAAGQGGWKAWAYPISVDLLLVAAWRRMRQQQRAGQAAGSPRLWFLVALAASLGANVATAGLLDLDHVPASLRVVVTGWPAVAFFGGTLLAHTPHGPDPVAVPEAPTTDPSEEQATAPATAPATVDAPAPDALPAPAPEPPTAEPETVPAPPPGPAVALPPVLIDRVRALADEHRSATGRPADPDAVRVRLGLPPSMTASVAAHL
ncbi:SpdA protein [Streptomyces regensis]|nr:SpdA protein [Streptomyces regensis]